MPSSLFNIEFLRPELITRQNNLLLGAHIQEDSVDYRLLAPILVSSWRNLLWQDSSKLVMVMLLETDFNLINEWIGGCDSAVRTCVIVSGTNWCNHFKLEHVADENTFSSFPQLDWRRSWKNQTRSQIFPSRTTRNPSSFFFFLVCHCMGKIWRCVRKLLSEYISDIPHLHNLHQILFSSFDNVGRFGSY